MKRPIPIWVSAVVLAVLMTAGGLSGLSGAVSKPKSPAKPKARIEIVEMTAPASVSGAPAIPWVAEKDASWEAGAPLFTVAGEGSLSAKGWAAVTDTNILLKVVVQDATHVNERKDGSIWDGDCLQIGVDARGEGSGDRPPETP